MPSALNPVNLKLNTNSQFSFSNGSNTQTETVKSAYVQLVQPVLSWEVTWNATTGDAGDIVGCSISIKHAANSSALAYGIHIVAQLSPYYNLNNASIVTSYPDPLAAPFYKSEYTGITYLPKLLLGENVTVNFTTVLDNSVLASSIIRTHVLANYYSQASNGQNWYPF